MSQLLELQPPTQSKTPKMTTTPFDKLREECGVMAIYNHTDAARLTYWGLYALQHRGQESAGIATSDGDRITDFKGMGLVSEIFTDPVLAKLPGHIAIGHTRYSTTGDSALLNAQPITVESTKGLLAIAHNGNLINLGTSKARLERDGAVFQTTSDSEIIVQLIAHCAQNTLVDCIAEALAEVDGAFSIVMMTRNRIFAARDPHGFRPLSMGRIPGENGAPDTFVFASETCAFDLLHAKYERDVEPGELIMVSEDGVTSRRYAPATTPHASCIFEHVYFARPDSRIYGRPVQQSRDEMGRQLARESHVAADLVVPVPDSGVTAALGYAAQSGIPFNFGLIRNHYVGRTFIQPEQRVRDFGVRMKLNPVRNLLQGKRVILIDDSIIRGTTSRKIVRMCRAAGATEVHMRISCPPTISPCFYGVDTPSKEHLIAANKSSPKSATTSRPTPSPTSPSSASPTPAPPASPPPASPPPASAPPATPATTPPSGSTSKKSSPPSPPSPPPSNPPKTVAVARSTGQPEQSAFALVCSTLSSCAKRSTPTFSSHIAWLVLWAQT